MTYQMPRPEQKARYVRGKFDEIARKYDLFNDLITQGQHRLWKRTLVKRLELKSGSRGADLCCGTGDIAFRLMNRVGAEGSVVAMDFSLGMLETARERLGRTSSGGRVGLLTGDAMRLPLATASLDFVTIGYGLRNVSDLDECLREILRVLKPGGVMGSLDVGQVRSPLIRPFSDFYLFRIVPLIGGLLQKNQDMFSYLPHSTKDYPPQQELKRRMESLGFERVEVLEYVFGASAIHLARKPG